MSLADKFLGGLSWTSLSVGVKGITQLLQMVILANYLGKDELGLIVILLLTVSLANLFVDFGLSNAIIFNGNLNNIQLNDLHWLNIVSGFFFALVFVVMSPYIEDFYEVIGLSNYISILSVIFIIRSFGIQGFALLQKKLDFSCVSKIEVISSVVNFCFLFLALFMECGIYSIIISQVVGSLFFSTLSCFYSKIYFPKFEVIRFQRIKEPIYYGSYQTGENFLNFLSANSDSIIISKGLGMTELGIYGYTRDLVLRPILQVFNNILNRVSFPVFSRVNDEIKLKNLYIIKVKFLLLLNIMYLLPIFVYPEFFIELIYGGSWVKYSSLLQLSCIYVFFLSLSNPSSALLKATGNVNLSFKWNLFVSVFRPIIVIISISGGVHSVMGSLAALSIITYFLHQAFILKAVLKLDFIYWVKIHGNMIVITVAMTFYSILSSYLNNIDEKFHVIGFITVLFILACSLIKGLYKEFKKHA